MAKAAFPVRNINDLPTTEYGSLTISDVDHDGIPDLVAVNSEVSIAFGTSAGGFRTPVDYTVAGGSELFSVITADLRNDGLLDIIADSYDGVTVLLNKGKGTFKEGVFTKLPVSAGCGVSADFNGDGKPGYEPIRLEDSCER